MLAFCATTQHFLELVDIGAMLMTDAMLDAEWGSAITVLELALFLTSLAVAARHKRRGVLWSHVDEHAEAWFLLEGAYAAA